MRKGLGRRFPPRTEAVQVVAGNKEARDGSGRYFCIYRKADIRY